MNGLAQVVHIFMSAIASIARSLPIPYSSRYLPNFPSNLFAGMLAQLVLASLGFLVVGLSSLLP